MQGTVQCKKHGNPWVTGNPLCLRAFVNLGMTPVPGMSAGTACRLTGADGPVCQLRGLQHCNCLPMNNHRKNSVSRPRGWAGAALLALSLLGGCDYIAEKKLSAGESTEADVRRYMGEPEMIWEEQDGSRTLEYPRGPLGKETYFVVIGADGRYRSITQVLNEENFRKVQPGMTRDEVRQILGKPGEITRYKGQNEEVWSWRYLGGDTRTMFFLAYFDQDTGKLKRTDAMQDWKKMGH